MDMKGFQQYKEQSVNTMTQGELLLLLYDELYKRLSQAELMLDQQNYPVYESSIERSVAIIDYLDSTLDRQYPISGNLAQLYEYFTYELGRAKIGRRKEVLSHVKSMVAELRDAFRQAQKSGDSGK
ncbi:flagellar export chaperone FliS [uncultured Oscillibacter sp.]|jgi:flagellar protein FliS|uniref:flagellar export chaperone FliS n=1 Tax=uncultured Oscillibacter sp. TaxID=876091 RepID=UPI00216EB8A2|nr:flagellar export chaperone FliS [uncultured Oscillibacter sp.]MCI9553735.1 flagellar export chaperone FliS [Oscillibacter sp.]